MPVSVPSADSAHDAWLARWDSKGGVLLSRWNGSTWRSANTPNGFGSNVSWFPVDAVGPADVWAFPGVVGTSATTQYATHWNGGTWTTYPLGAKGSLTATAALGATNAWVFGEKPGNPGPLGLTPPFAMHYDGAGWRPASVPIDVLRVGKVSASSFWIGGSPWNSTNYLAYLWTGKAWSKPVPVPTPAKVNGDGWSIVDSFGQSAQSLWALARLNVTNRGTGYAPPGDALLHWNGSKWSVAAETLAAYLYNFVPDGGGGFWLAGNKPGSSTELFAHYSGGRWSYPSAPKAPSGYGYGIVGFSQIPGTRSLWAVAVLNPNLGGPSEYALLKYGP